MFPGWILDPLKRSILARSLFRWPPGDETGARVGPQAEALAPPEAVMLGTLRQTAKLYEAAVVEQGDTEKDDDPPPSVNPTSQVTDRERVAGTV